MTAPSFPPVPDDSPIERRCWHPIRNWPTNWPPVSPESSSFSARNLRLETAVRTMSLREYWATSGFYAR